MTKTKTMICVLLLVAMLGLSACSGSSGNGSETSESTETNTETKSGASVYETDVVTIDGIAVNDGYVDGNNESSSLKMVYLFMTFHPQEENIPLSSDMFQMTINDKNSYMSDHYPDDGVEGYVRSYYYSSYIEDIYMGETKKLVAAFKVPEADLAAGRSILIDDATMSIPTMDKLRLSTDDIQHFASGEELATAIDAEGAAAEADLRADADPETAARVKSLLNGYQWSFYVNYTSYKLAFWADENADNNFAVQGTINGSTTEPQQGTYSVKKGYIFCTYPGNNYTVEIPYTLTDGGIDLDVVTGFSVFE